MHVICIEGLDGVGKESVANELYDYIQSCGFSVRKVSFPQYDALPGKTIKNVLSGAYGDASTMHYSLIGPLYTLDRIGYFKCELEELRRFDFVILDRSYYSNFIYQASKLWYSIEPASFAEENRIAELVEWCKQNYLLELKETGILKAADSIQVVYLDLPETDRKKQISSRPMQDTNELNIDYLNRCSAFMSPGNIAVINMMIPRLVPKEETFMDFYTGKCLTRFDVIHADNSRYSDIRTMNYNLAINIFQSLITKIYSKLDNRFILYRNDIHQDQIRTRFQEYLKYLELSYLDAPLFYQVRDNLEGKEIVVYTVIANCSDPAELSSMLEGKLQEIVSDELQGLVNDMNDTCSIIPIARVI